MNAVVSESGEGMIRRHAGRSKKGGNQGGQAMGRHSQELLGKKAKDGVE
jgi:hypothetical protein